jgi:hypothetical protein
VKDRTGLPTAKEKGKAPLVVGAITDNARQAAAPGRPSNAQWERVKALRADITEGIASLAEEFQTKPEAVLRQLGLGTVETRKVSLVNLYSQIYSLNGGGEGLGCKSSIVYSFLAFYSSLSV